MVCPWQISQGTRVVTVDVSCWGRAQRTWRRGLGRAHPQGDPGRSVIDRTPIKVQRSCIRE